MHHQISIDQARIYIYFKNPRSRLPWGHCHDRFLFLMNHNSWLSSRIGIPIHQTLIQPFSPFPHQNPPSSIHTYTYKNSSTIIFILINLNREREKERKLREREKIWETASKERERGRERLEWKREFQRLWEWGERAGLFGLKNPGVF